MQFYFEEYSRIFTPLWWLLLHVWDTRVNLLSFDESNLRGDHWQCAARLCVCVCS